MLEFSLGFRRPGEMPKNAYGVRGRLQMIRVKCDNCGNIIAEFRQPAMETSVINKLMEEIYCDNCKECQDDEKEKS